MEIITHFLAIALGAGIGFFMAALCFASRCGDCTIKQYAAEHREKFSECPIEW